MSFLKKQAPAWSVLLAALISAGSLTTAFVVVPQLSDAMQSMRDYSIAASPSSLIMNQGSTVTATVTVSSVNGFNVATGLSTSVSASATGLTASLSQNVVTPSSGGKASSTLMVTSTLATPAGTHQVTVSSSGGTKSHSVTVSVTVAAADFTITPTVSSMIVTRGGYNTTMLTIAGVAAFSGNVSLSATEPFDIVAWGSSTTVYLTVGGSVTSMFAVSASPTAALGNYTVTVTGTAGAITHSTDIRVQVKASGGCGPPMCGTEQLSLESHIFNSGTNVTLYLRNTGTSDITLVSYNVRDTSGNMYSNTAWSGPTIVPNNIAATNFLIGSSCPGCTLSGSAFTFTTGNTYLIDIITARNNQFTFALVR